MLQRPDNFSFPARLPADARTLITESFTGSVPDSYVGMVVFSTTDQKQYWNPASRKDFIEYHPELVYTPQESYTITTDTDAKSQLTTASSYTPIGTEATVKADNGSFYKYIWDGSDWQSYANIANLPVVSSSSAASGIEIVTFNAETDSISSFNEVTSDKIKEKTSTSTGGSELNVVFTDADANQSFRKYIYLNNEWRILTGTCEISFNIPYYTSAENNWNNWTVPTVSNIQITKLQEGAISVLIPHPFCMQYVDISIYEQQTSADIDGDNVLDTYGSQLLALTDCIKYGSGNYGIRLELAVQKDDTTESTTNKLTTYTIILQR